MLKHILQWNQFFHDPPCSESVCAKKLIDSIWLCFRSRFEILTLNRKAGNLKGM